MNSHQKYQNFKRSNSLYLILFTLLVLFTNCAGPSIFPQIPLSNNPPVLSQPIYLAIDEASNRGYLLNSNNTVLYADGSLQVLNLTNPIAPTVVRAVSLPNFSGEAYLDTANKFLYVTNRLNQSKVDNNDQILKINIDETSNQFLTYEEFQTDSNPFGIASDGTSLYVVNQGSLDSFLLSNLSNRTQVNFNVQISGGGVPNTGNTRQMAISPSGNYLYITNQNGPMLILNKSQIPAPSGSYTNAGTESVDYVINNTFSTLGIASDTNYLYVVEASTPSLKVLTDQGLGTVQGNPLQVQLSSLEIAQIPLGNSPNEIALDTVNSRAYVTLAQDSQLSVINTTTFTEVARISLPSGANPFGVSVGHFGGIPYIYVLNLNTNNISIINGNTLAIVGSFP